MILLYPTPPLDVSVLSAEERDYQLSLRRSAVLEFTGEDNVGYLILNERDPLDGDYGYRFLRLNADGTATREDVGYLSLTLDGAICSAMDDWFYLDGDTSLPWYRDLVNAETILGIAAMALTSGLTVRKLKEKFPPKRELFRTVP